VKITPADEKRIKFNAAMAAAHPTTARLVCMAAARPYIGGKKRAANSLPVSSAAGCCTSEM